MAADDKEPFAACSSALAAFLGRDLERSGNEARAELALSPSFAIAHNMLGSVETHSGRPLAAITHIERAMRLDPRFNHQYLHFLGFAYLLAGKFETAAVALKQRVLLAPQTDLTPAFLASALGHLGEYEEARRVWSELKSINPGYSFATHMGRLPFRRREDWQVIAEGLARAGLPVA
jgi:adenylate cyclase